MNANNTYNSGDSKHNTYFTHHLWCFEHAWRLEVSAVKKKKVKIAGELFNSIKNNQHLILPVSFEIQYNYVYHRFVLIT